MNNLATKEDMTSTNSIFDGMQSVSSYVKGINDRTNPNPAPDSKDTSRLQLFAHFQKTMEILPPFEQDVISNALAHAQENGASSARYETEDRLNNQFRKSRRIERIGTGIAAFILSAATFYYGTKYAASHPAPEKTVKTPSAQLR